MKLSLIFNIAPYYRKRIYQLIDNSYDCNWFFGENKSNIKSMDLNLLKHVTIGQNHKLFLPNIYWQRGVFRFVKMHDAETYLILGEPICISTWLVLLYLNLFKSTSIYLWTHGWYGKETLMKKFIKRIFFSMVDGIFLYGNYAKKLMIKEGVDGGKLFVIHNSLDYEKQLELRILLRPESLFVEHFCNSSHTLIFIGRLTKEKRLELLIEAIAILRMHKQYFNLVLIGDGDAMKQLKVLASDKKLIDNIWFYGACYDEAINARLIYNADLCISPGFVGLTAIHSMMFGTPVITHSNFKYQAPEFEAIKDGITGAFFEMNNVSSLVRTIYRWFNRDGYNRDEIRKNCYDEIDKNWNPKFQIDVIKENLIYR